MTLSELKPGQTGIVTRVTLNNLRKRIIDMGVVNGTRIHVKKLAPLGDPMEIVVRGYLLTIRKAEARAIEIALAEASL
jgi:Fe2+ transport system protein FeoA